MLLNQKPGHKSGSIGVLKTSPEEGRGTPLSQISISGSFRSQRSLMGEKKKGLQRDNGQEGNEILLNNRQELMYPHFIDG